MNVKDWKISISNFISSGDGDLDHDIEGIAEGIIVDGLDEVKNDVNENATERISIQSFIAQLNPQLTSNDDGSMTPISDVTLMSFLKWP